MPKVSLFMMATLALMLAGSGQAQPASLQSPPAHTAHKTSRPAPVKKGTPAGARGSHIRHVTTGQRATVHSSAVPARPAIPQRRSVPTQATRKRSPSPPAAHRASLPPVAHKPSSPPTVPPVRPSPRIVPRTSPPHRTFLKPNPPRQAVIRTPAKTAGRFVRYAGKVLRGRGRLFVLRARRGKVNVNATRATIRYRGRTARTNVIKPGKTVAVFGLLRGATLRAKTVLVR